MTFEDLKGIMAELSVLMEKVSVLDTEANEVDDAYSEMDSAFGNLEKVALREFPDEVEVLVYDYDGMDKDPTYRCEIWRGPLGDLIEGQEKYLGSALDTLSARRLLALRDPEVAYVEFPHLTVAKNFSP